MPRGWSRLTPRTHRRPERPPESLPLAAELGRLYRARLQWAHWRGRTDTMRRYMLARLLEALEAGASYGACARALGCSRERAYRLAQEAREQIPTDPTT